MAPNPPVGNSMLALLGNPSVLRKPEQEKKAKPLLRPVVVRQNRAQRRRAARLKGKSGK